MSEFMLQQTQVGRVIPIFQRFVAEFPSFEALAAVQAGEVVRAWRGLGYNSRAVRLHALARAVCKRHRGRLPRRPAALRALPGVGPYTAQAIRAFAYDCDEVALDTNVRRVVGRFFFGAAHAAGVPLADLESAGKRFLRAGRAFESNSAIMDLGATVCTERAPKCLLCPLVRDCAAAAIIGTRTAPRCSRGAVPFERTNRYLRGRIVEALRALGEGQALTARQLHRAISTQGVARTLEEVKQAVSGLARDGVLRRDGPRLSL